MTARNTLTARIARLEALLLEQAPAHTPGSLTTCQGLTKALTQCQKAPATGAGQNVHFCPMHQEQAPQARQARKAARKAPKASTKATTKGASALKAQGGTLSTKEWNRTLTAKARFAGGGTYAYVLRQWDAAQEARKAGTTPDAFLAALIAEGERILSHG